jgi:Flp pilus assembly protein TadD
LDTALREGGGGSEADKFAANWLKEHAKDGEFRLYLAQGASKRKDYTSAIHHYRILLDIYPNNAILLNNLAWAAGRSKDPAALEYAEKANNLAPDQPAIMDTLGTLLVEQGDIGRGVELLQKAASLAPQAPDFRLNLAKGLIKAGRKEDAKKELDELAKLGDKYPAHGEVAQLMKNL